MSQHILNKDKCNYTYSCKHIQSRTGTLLSHSLYFYRKITRRPPPKWYSSTIKAIKRSYRPSHELPLNALDRCAFCSSFNANCVIASASLGP